MRGVFGLSVLSAALMVSAAQAADLPVKALPKVVPASNWTGFYAGVSGGYGWSDSNITLLSIGIEDPLITGTSASATPPILHTHPEGGIVGGQLGYNRQINQMLWGLEADFSYADIKGSDIQNGVATVPGAPLSHAHITAVGEQKLDFLGTIRGRLGFLPANSVLLYGTAGLAYGHVTSRTDTFDAGAQVLTSPASGTVSTMRAGWIAGGGIESMLPFAPRWSLKAEYLYYDLGKTSYALSPASVFVADFTPPPVGVVNTTATAEFHGSLVRVGLNYKFN